MPLRVSGHDHKRYKNILNTPLKRSQHFQTCKCILQSRKARESSQKRIQFRPCGCNQPFRRNVPFLHLRNIESNGEGENTKHQDF